MDILSLIVRAIVVMEIIAGAVFLFYAGQVWQPIVIMLLGVGVAAVLEELG